MTDLKREYNVPLRQKFLTAPRWKRTKKAISVLKEFMSRHMKCENTVICAELNQLIWNKGAKNPPAKVSVTALKTKINDKEFLIIGLDSKDIENQLKLYKIDKVENIEKTDEKKVVETSATEKKEEKPKKEKEVENDKQ